MKIEKLMVFLLTAIISVTAMTGIAAAATVTIADDPIANPLDGNHVTTTTVTLTNIDYREGIHTRCTCVKTNKVGLDGRVTGLPGSGDTWWANNADWACDTYTATTGDYTFTLSVNGTEEGSITVSDNAGTTRSPEPDDDIAMCTRPVIPEFAIIALPVLTMLGLVMYFNYRKNKREK